jgi:rhodanese-related sulfurtransferase
VSQDRINPTTGLPEGYPFQRDWELTPRELKSLIDQRAPLVVIDVRTESERTLASIANTLHIPIAELPARLPSLREHEADRIVVMCHHGTRSLKATELLRQAGFEDVRSLAGGIHLWSMDIDPSVPAY